MTTLSDKARELHNAYQRKWRRKNPEKLKEYNMRYWEKKAAQLTPEQQARELKEQGFTQRQIAETLNISLGAVNKLLKDEESNCK